MSGPALTARTSTLTTRSLQTAVRVALVVGTVLVAINQAPALLGGRLTPALGVRVALTNAVPFLVSIYAAWRAVSERTSTRARPGVADVTSDQDDRAGPGHGRGVSDRADAKDGKCRKQ